MRQGVTSPAGVALDVTEMTPLSMRVAVLGDDEQSVRRLILFNAEGAVEASAGATALDGSQQCVARPVPWQGDRHRPVLCQFWDLPKKTLEAQPSVFWSVAVPATSAVPKDDQGKPWLQAVIVVASDIESAVRWGLGYRQASSFDARRPIVLAWCGGGPNIPNKRQAMVTFVAVERYDPATGEGARTILEAVATALMQAEKPCKVGRRCVMS